jgi:hypothetical protein
VNATDTRPAPQHTEPLTAARALRTALAITLGILTSLAVTLVLFALVLSPSGDAVLEFDGFVDEQVTELSSSQGTDAAEVNTVSARPDPWWMSGEDCPADACTMIAPRTRTA